MTALAAHSVYRQAQEVLTGLQVPIYASTTLYQGGMVCLRTADGYAVKAGTQGTGRVVGVARAPSPTPATSGAANVNLLTGVFAFPLGGTSPTIANVGQLVYAVDDQTISSNPSDGPVAGVLIGFEEKTGYALVLIEPDQDIADVSAQAFKARAVITSIAAYTGTGTGTLTGSANGAIGTQDGLTLAAGDVVLLPAGLSNVTAADAGPYVVQAVGGASAKFVLVRPWWYKHGAAIRQGLVIEVGGEGTLFAGTSWKSFVAGGKVIGTDDPLLYPGRVTQSVTLVAGTATISNVPIRSATKTGVVLTRTTANTSTATTGGYQTSTFTAGALGTASLVIQAAVAAGTINNADISTLAATIINW